MGRLGGVRFLGSAFVSSDRTNLLEAAAISSTAAWNANSFVFEGFVNPLIFLTNWSEAARMSSSVHAGS